MAKSCSSTTSNQTEALRKEIVKKVKDLNINLGNLSNAEVEAAMHKLATEKQWSDEVLFNPIHRQDLISAISAARIQKSREEEILKNNKIGNATVKIAKEPWKKSTPANNPNSIYLYGENLQAHNKFASDEDKVSIPGLVEVSGGPKTNVQATSAVIRTNTNDDKYPNTFGIITKKNAQNKAGKFIKDEGTFTDTDEEFRAFVSVNAKVISQIKDLLEQENSPITELNLPEKLAVDNSGLPLRFAEALSNMLYKQLGISTQVVPSSYGNDRYGLELQPFGRSSSSSNESSNKDSKEKTPKERIEEKAKKDKEEATKSLEASRPKLSSDNLKVQKEDLNILARIFPDIEQRAARVSLISTLFSDSVTSLLSRYKDYYTKRIESSPSESDVKMYTLLTTGTEAEQRKALLENSVITDKNGTILSITDYIINQIKEAMSSIITIVEQINSGKLSASDAIEAVFGAEAPGTLTEDEKEEFYKTHPAPNFIARDFRNEALDKGWEGKKLEKVKIQRLRYLAEQYKVLSNPEIFNALFNAAATEIEFTENIRIIQDSNTNSHTVGTTVNDEQKIEEDSEGSVDNRSGLNLVKYKLLDPAKTMSIRMKYRLGHLYKMANGQYIYNDLGQRVRINSSLAYYILMHHFSDMNRSSDFEGALEEAERKYPWILPLVSEMSKNEDLRNEFYSTFRKVFIPYAIIGTSGTVIKLNSTANRESLLQEISRLYEGRAPISKDSIYDNEGLCNPINVAKVHTWVVRAKSTNAQNRQRVHPFDWVKRIIDKPNSSDFTAENLVTVSKMLRGEINGIPGIEDLLHALGVPTDGLDLDSLVPYIYDDLNERLNSHNPEERREAFEELTQDLFSEKVRKDISKIIQAAINITSVRDGGTRGFKEGDHLVSDFRGAYSNIADALAISSEAFNQASFSGMGYAQMFSYSAPDKVSILSGIISKAKTADGAREYIQQEFGQYDFFRDQKTGEWFNSWLEDLYENPELRAQFTYINVLGFRDKKNKKNNIQSIKDTYFTDGIITAMFMAGELSNGTKLGYFRNPLFSDTPALVMMKQKRYTGKDYKEQIIKRLVKVLRQEIDRITFYSRQSETNPEVEFFNDDKFGNALKFNYFPSLNSKIKDIFETLASISDNYESLTEAEEVKDEYLASLILDIIEGERNVEGQREGGELEDFLESVGNTRAIAILNKISRVENKEAKSEEQDDESNDDTWEESEEEESSEEENKEINERLLREAREKLTEFFYNDFLGQIMFTQMLNGDAAQFKNYDDSVKRAKEGYACGERAYSLDSSGNPLMETCMYCEDLEAVSNTWTKLRDLLDADNSNLSSWEKGIYRGAIEAFKTICTTDGQSLRTLKSFRKLFKAFGGKWTDNMEVAYNNIRNGKFNASDFLALWNPIKPFVVSNEILNMRDSEGNTRREKIGVQHKNSEYLISALFGVLNTALNSSPQLRGLQSFMEKHDIDVMHFHSVVKHGAFSLFDINYNYGAFDQFIADEVSNQKSNVVKINIGNATITLNNNSEFSDYKDKVDDLLFTGKITQQEYNDALDKFSFKTEDEVIEALENQATILSLDEEGNPSLEYDLNKFHVLPIEDYMIVQPSDDHLIGHDALFGSQLRNIAPADLPENFSVEVKINGKSVNLGKDELVQYYDTLIIDQLISSFSSLDRRFSDDKELASYLNEMMRNNPKYGDDIKAALSIDPKTGTFKMPFNSPTVRNKVEELLLSVFKNNVQRQKINGGNVILVSNFGLSNNLHVKYKENDKSKGIEYIPAYMPAYMREMYSDYLVERTDRDGSSYWTIDFEAIKRNNDEDILKIIGYRIPTEDKYSIMPIKIVGFMPVVAGTTIMLPSDIITMSGTDFDIDKLFLMIKATIREVYDKTLSNKFSEWTNKETIEFLEKHDPEQFNVIQKIINRKHGFTEGDINNLRDKSDIFDTFMEEVGYSYRLRFPKYKVKRGRNITDENGKINLNETSKLRGSSKKEAHDIRNNMLIDVIWSIMTSEAGSRLSMLPGSYPRVKHGSRQQWILHDKKALAEFVKLAGGYEEVFDKLMSMDTKELDKFYSKYATPANPFTITAYVKKHRNLMDGNALIGIFAVSSSNHYKLQFLNSGRRNPTTGELDEATNILLNSKNRFYFTLNGKTMMISWVSPQKSPITGVNVGRICAEFQAASPDNGKDPTLGDLGASEETAERINFLNHLGFPPEITGMINTTDDLVDFGKDHTSAETSKVPFNGDIRRIVGLMVRLRLGVLTDPKDIEDAARASKWIQNLWTCAKSFNEISSISRVDSPNGALPVNCAAVIQQLFKIEDFYTHAKSKAYEIQGLDRFIDPTIDVNDYNSYEEFRDAILNRLIPRMQAFYTLGIKSARDLASNKLIQLREPVLAGLRELGSQIKKPLSYSRDIATIQKFISELTMFMMSSTGSLFATDENTSIMDKRNYYIHDFPMKYKEFLNQKNPDGSYKYNKIRNLPIIKRISNANRAGIKFNKIGKVSPPARKHYVEAMDSLLYNPDPEVQKFAIDLLMYSYFDNGLNFGPNSFGVFFSTYFLNNIPGVIDILTRENGNLESSSSIMDRFLPQFILNHPEIVFTPFTRSQRASITIKKQEGTLEISKKNADFLRAGIDATGDYIDFLYYNKALYQKVTGDEGISPTILRYKKIAYNKTGNEGSVGYTPFYDANSEAHNIKWDNLQQRGAVSSDEIKKEQKKKASDKEDNSKKRVPKEDDNDRGNEVKMQVPRDDDAVEVDYGIMASFEDGDTGRNVSPDDIVNEEEDEREKLRQATYIQGMENINVTPPNEFKEPDLTSFEDTKDPSNRLCKKKKQ